MKRIAIIVFYFGEFPWYHDFFINSCYKNTTINFLFFSDQFKEIKKNNNIKEIPFSVNDFNKLSSMKLGFKVELNNGLKICDFRPAFGLIFEDYLSDYDFWGYSDTDIVFGRLREFLNDECLKNDFISVVPDYPSGFFAVYKNNVVMKYLFQKSNNYKEAFLSIENTLFEECGGYYNEVMNGVNILETNSPIQTFHHVLEMNKNVKSLFEYFSIEGNPNGVRYNKGVLTLYNKYEIMMYHLTNFKTNYFFNNKFKVKSYDDYKFYSYCINDNFFLKNIFCNANYFFIKFKFYCIRKFDKLISKKMKKEKLIGKYNYMQGYVEILQKDNYFEAVGDVNGVVLNSVFNSNLCFIKNTDLYFYENNKNLHVILKSGQVLVYKRCNDNVF